MGILPPLTVVSCRTGKITSDVLDTITARCINYICTFVLLFLQKHTSCSHRKQKKINVDLKINLMIILVIWIEFYYIISLINVHMYLRTPITRDLRTHITRDLRTHITRDLRRHITRDLPRHITRDLRTHITRDLRTHITRDLLHCTFTALTNSSFFTTATLLLFGDIQPNPGPTHPANLLIAASTLAPCSPLNMLPHSTT